MRFAVAVVSLLVFAAPVARAQDGALTDKECTAVAQSCEKAIAARQAKKFDAQWDRDKFCDLMLASIEAPAAKLDGFRKGFTGAFNLGAQICDGLGDDGSYKFVRLQPGANPGERRAIFRFTRGDNFNYHELVLARRGAVVKVVDCYIHLQGALLTETYRRIAIHALVQNDRTLLDKLAGRDGEFARSLPEIQQMNKLSAQQKHAEALRVYDKLPDSVKKDRLILIHRLSAASQVSEEEAIKAHDALVAEAGEDPSLALVLFSGYALKKRWDDALKALDRIEKQTGADAYLDYQRSAVEQNRKDFDAARKLCKKALAAEPTLAEAYYQLLIIAVEAKAWPEVVEHLGTIEKRFGPQSVDGLSGAITGFKDFLASKEGKAWLAKQQPTDEKKPARK